MHTSLIIQKYIIFFDNTALKIWQLQGSKRRKFKETCVMKFRNYAVEILMCDTYVHMSKHTLPHIASVNKNSYGCHCAHEPCLDNV